MSRIHTLALLVVTFAAAPAHAQSLHPACADQAAKMVTSTQGPYQLTSVQGPYQLTSVQGPYQLAPVILEEAYGRELSPVVTLGKAPLVELTPASFNSFLPPTTTQAGADFLLELDGIKFSEPSGLEDASIDPDEIDYDGGTAVTGVEPDEIDYAGEQEGDGIDPDEIDYDGGTAVTGVEPDEIDYAGEQAGTSIIPEEIDYDDDQKATGVEPDEIDVAVAVTPVVWMTLIPGKYHSGDVVGCAVLDEGALSAAAPR